MERHNRRRRLCQVDADPLRQVDALGIRAAYTGGFDAGLGNRGNRLFFAERLDVFERFVAGLADFATAVQPVIRYVDRIDFGHNRPRRGDDNAHVVDGQWVFGLVETRRQAVAFIDMERHVCAVDAGGYHGVVALDDVFGFVVIDNDFDHFEGENSRIGLQRGIDLLGSSIGAHVETLGEICDEIAEVLPQWRITREKTPLLAQQLMDLFGQCTFAGAAGEGRQVGHSCSSVWALVRSISI